MPGLLAGYRAGGFWRSGGIVSRLGQWHGVLLADFYEYG